MYNWLRCGTSECHGHHGWLIVNNTLSIVFGLGKKLGRMRSDSPWPGIIYLAFFTVVASCPNLSTFVFGCKGKK